jgi:alpha-D-ribose 1-methylphosphonate 5-triphosphate synthase subunit PhnG
MNLTMNMLSVLARAPAQRVVALADTVLPELPAVEVVTNRAGIVMLPAEDTSTGALFHIGEVMVSEAHVRLVGRDVNGYGACLGRDAAHALAIAVLDASLRAGMHTKPIEAFCAEHSAHLRAEDEGLSRDVERTRVVMETF